MGGSEGKHAAPPPPAAPQPTLQDAAAKLEKQIATLEQKIQKSDEEAKQWVAKAATNPTAKARAMQCLKMKKQYEQQRDQLMGTQFNIENMAFQQEQASVTADAVAALAAGRDQMKAQQQKLNVEAVDKLTDDLAELTAEMKEIQDALANSALAGGPQIDESDLNAEWERMQEQAAMEKLMQGLPSSSTAAPAQPAAPVHVAQPAAKAAAMSAA